MTINCNSPSRFGPSHQLYRLLLSLTLIALGVSSQTTISRGQTPVSIAKQSQSACVTIFTSDSHFRLLAIGSGFFIANDTVVTCFHVIDRAMEAFVKTGSGELYRVQGIIGYDKKADLCTLKIAPTKIDPLVIAEKESEVGERVYAFGNPSGLEGTFTEGTISALREANEVGQIQFTAPVDHGSSGGPLINSKGQVIGIVAAKLDNSNAFNFAVPTRYLALLPHPDSGRLASLRKIGLGYPDEAGESDYLDQITSSPNRRSLAGLNEFDVTIDAPFLTIKQDYDAISLNKFETSPNEVSESKSISLACATRIADKLRLLGMKCHINDEKPNLLGRRVSPQIKVVSDNLITNINSAAGNDHEAPAYDIKGNGMFRATIIVIDSLGHELYRQDMKIFSGYRDDPDKSIRGVQNVMDTMVDEFIVDYLIANSDCRYQVKPQAALK